MKPLILSLLMLCAGSAVAQAPKLEMPKLEVAVKRVEIDAERMYEVNATGTVAASLPTVWRILTTYERMQEFVPDLTSCRVVSRNGNEVIVEQFGNAHFLFMSRAIHLVVRVNETPLSAIDISLISGDMKHYEARWELTPIPETGGTRISYHGKLLPSFYVPGMFGNQMIRGDIERMMSAVLARIDSKRD